MCSFCLLHHRTLLVGVGSAIDAGSRHIRVAGGDFNGEF